VSENTNAAQQLLAASSRKSSSDALRATSTNLTLATAVVPGTRPLSLKKRPSFLEFEPESDVTAGDDFLDLTDGTSSIDIRYDDQATVTTAV